MINYTPVKQALLPPALDSLPTHIIHFINTLLLLLSLVFFFFCKNPSLLISAMTSRSFTQSSDASTFVRTKVLFLALILSSSIVILLAVLYLLYHFYYSLLNRTRTIPFDSSAPLKIQRFTYRELKTATNDFKEDNVLGKGGSGTVFRGQLRDGKLIAIKRIDCVSLETEREFQNELHILGGLRSPFLVNLLGYCAEKNKRMLVYEYMPNRSLQEAIFSESKSNMLSWDRRFAIIVDVARALEFLHLGCDPPVIHGDVKPSNVLLDSDFRAKVSDFGLSRMKVEGEFAADLFSQELSGVIEAVDSSSPKEVDFALALQASSSSRNIKAAYNAKAMNLNPVNGEFVKGKEVEVGIEDWNSKSVPPCDESQEKEVKSNGSTWGKDWWWRQDGSGELCSKDYVQEWIGSQICESTATTAVDWDDEGDDKKTDLTNPKSTEDAAEPTPVQPGNVLKEADELEQVTKPPHSHRKIMQEWWKEERVAETNTRRKKYTQLKILGWKKRFKLRRCHLVRPFHLYPLMNKMIHRKKHGVSKVEEGDAEFSFSRGLNKHKVCGSEMWSGDVLSRELSSTTSMRGTLCYVAPEYGGFGSLLEKSDVYSFGVLLLVIVSGRRPLHVLSSPMKFEKANLVSWCRHLSHSGDVVDLVDERLLHDHEEAGGLASSSRYNVDEARLCINVALSCLQKIPELRPDIGDVVRILQGEMDLPPLPFEFSPSPPASKSKSFSKSRQKHK